MHKIVETAKKFVARHSSQLTRLQPYVYCTHPEVAEAVALYFNCGSFSIQDYPWQTGPAAKKNPHWCVTPDVPWVLAGTDEVRVGQFYIGPWQAEKLVRGIWEDIVKGVDTVDDYISGVGPCKEAGFVLVNALDHANPGEPRLFRHQLKAGETFEYINKPGRKYVVMDPSKSLADQIGQMPQGWGISIEGDARRGGQWNVEVKRIPHWDDEAPVVLPCVAPLDDFDRLCGEKVDGLTGLECLERFELALRTESFGRRDGKLYVPVPEGRDGVVGGAHGGLVEAQIVFAKRVWTAKLKKLAAAKRAAEAQAAYNLVLCDDVDGLPNMAEAP